jgi:dihydroorotase
MNPPLRTEADRQALLQAVGDGTLDVIATDHAPHTAEAKARGFLAAPFGVIGMETALAVIWTRLVLKDIVTPLQMAQRMSAAPAAAFRLPAGSLQPGMPADVTVFDPEARWTVVPASFRSRSRNCPFAGWELQGRVRATIVGGDVRHHEPVH